MCANTTRPQPNTKRNQINATKRKKTQKHTNQIKKRYALCRKTSLPLAVKTYRKRKLSALNRRQVAREVSIHARLNPPHVVALFAAFEDADKVYLLQEFAEGVS